MSSIRFSGLASGLDTENMIKELMKAERMKSDRVKKEKTKVEWKKDIWKEMNTKLYTFYTKSVFDLKSKSTFLQRNASSSDESMVSAKASVSAVKGTHTIKVKNLATSSFLTGEALDKDKNGKDITSSTLAQDLIDFGGDTEKTITINLENGATPINIQIAKTDSIGAISRKIKEKQKGINVSFDSNFKRMMMSTKDQGQGKQIKISGDDALLTALGLTSGKRIGSEGKDASFEYNNTVLTSSSNEVTINGLTMTLKGADENKAINITVTQDTEAIYDKVKDFIKKYNKLLLEMNEKVSAERLKGYEPLTSEEKKAMSDDDVKLWEDKIKKSLLRRDNTLSSVIDSMRSILTSSSGVETNGFDYKYLSELGIATGDYKEKGLLHIDGDEDDPLYAVKKNKVKEAIEKDPEKVAELLNALGDKLYNTMQDQMKSTKMSSALTFFNDKQMSKQIDDYEDKIYDLEKRLAIVEQRYYSQFAAMEKAIQQMNNQSASLVSMLGGGQ
jgi:flagellar hook-associated protein 2